MSVILMTTLFYEALILQGEMWCSSLSLSTQPKAMFTLDARAFVPWYCVHTAGTWDVTVYMHTCSIRPGRRHFETWASQGGMNVTELLRNKQQRKSTRSRSFLYSGTGTVPKFFGSIIDKGCVQIHEINVVSHTQYIIWVHPSIVMHWKTVIIATAMLSKVVMPSFGPTQLPLQLKPGSHFLPRNICLTPLNGPLSHGLGFSSIKPENKGGQGLKYWVWVAKGLWKKKALELFLTDNCWTKKGIRLWPMTTDKNNSMSQSGPSKHMWLALRPGKHQLLLSSTKHFHGDPLPALLSKNVPLPRIRWPNDPTQLYFFWVSVYLARKC